jgi:hypothetical protein
MAKDIKILSVNFPSKTPWVVQEPTLATPRALFDFDVVVIRPYLLHGKPGGPWSIDQRAYSHGQSEMVGKHEDMIHLLRQGGLLVVVLDAIQEFKFSTGRSSYMGETIYTLTNYDFLDFLEERFFHCVRNGTGNRVEILDGSEPFPNVLKSSEIEWTAFLVSRLPSYIGTFHGDGRFVCLRSKLRGQVTGADEGLIRVKVFSRNWQAK